MECLPLFFIPIFGIWAIILVLELAFIGFIIGSTYGFAAGFGTFLVAFWLCYFLPKVSAVLIGIMISIVWIGDIEKLPETDSGLDILARFAAAFLVGFAIQYALNTTLRDPDRDPFD